MIIGRTPTALLYAWRLQKEIILTEPFLFHRLSDEYEGIDFSEFKVGCIEEFVSNMGFIMGLLGLLKWPMNVSSCRLEDKAIITKHNTRVHFTSEPEIFDGEPTGEYQVFDEFFWRKVECMTLTCWKAERTSVTRFAFIQLEEVYPVIQKTSLSSRGWTRSSF
mgnify:CR=1 FL=1